MIPARIAGIIDAREGGLPPKVRGESVEEAGTLGNEYYFVGLLPVAELSVDVVVLGVLSEDSFAGPGSPERFESEEDFRA
jgi:hypothetical protein